jgi:peptidoglycan biosynthesis protein MviN/MurJ (putative lipid II flippase)
VVAAARRGGGIGDDSLAPAIVDYSRALHAAADTDTPLRRVVVGFVLVVAAAMALWDAGHGSPGNAVASAVYPVLVGLELFWWPNRRERLLSNADRATAMERQADIPD